MPKNFIVEHRQELDVYLLILLSVGPSKGNCKEFSVMDPT